jgi:hypothetical protein
MALTHRNITWKQANSWGWMPLTATFRWVNRTGHPSVRGDRLGAGAKQLFTMYANRGRIDELSEMTITRRVRDTVYHISHPGRPRCPTCGKTTWRLSAITMRCKGRRECIQRVREAMA